MEIFDEIKRMHEEMDKMFQNVFGYTRPLIESGKKSIAKYTGTIIPSVDVKETDKTIVCNIEIPGVEKENIDLNITKDSIEIRAKKKVEKELKQEKAYSYQASEQQFYRRVPLSTKVEADKAKASYKNGILRVEVPKIKRIGSKKKEIKIE